MRRRDEQGPQRAGRYKPWPRGCVLFLMQQEVTKRLEEVMCNLHFVRFWWTLLGNAVGGKWRNSDSFGSRIVISLMN